MHWDMETVVMDLRSTLSQTGSNPGSETPPRPVHPAHSVAGDSWYSACDRQIYCILPQLSLYVNNINMHCYTHLFP